MHASFGGHNDLGLTLKKSSATPPSREKYYVSLNSCILKKKNQYNLIIATNVTNSLGNYQFPNDFGKDKQKKEENSKIWDKNNLIECTIFMLPR